MDGKGNGRDSKKFGEYVGRVLEGKERTTLREGDLGVLKGKMLKSLEIDIQQLVSRQVFTSGLILRIPVIPVRDCRLATACTDGSRIFFDIDFYAGLCRKERVFVLAHEVWHVALMHFLRRGNRNPEVWNLATDCEINYALKQEGFSVPKDCCYPPRELEGLCAEDIYDKLAKAPKRERSGMVFNGSGNGNGGARDGGIGGQFDKHLDKSGLDGGDCGKNPENAESISDRWGEKGFDDDFKAEIAGDIADKIREMVISEVQQYERTRGTVPGHIKMAIDSVCEPEIRWEELLSQFVTSCTGDRRMWIPPARRGVYSGTYAQSRRGEKLGVACVVDTSGSTAGDLPKFMSELVSLLNTFGRYELSVINCDCQVQSVETFDDSNPFPVDDPASYDFRGGGGSDLNPAFEEIYKRGMEPSCVIVFTDGEILCPKGNPLNVPTLFILTADGNENLCDWGKKIKFNARRYGD
jgi:Uncharacterized protein conserved in bacteria